MFRSLLACLLLFSASVNAQVVGFIQCWHDAPGEKFGYITVTLMDGNTPRRSKTSYFDKLKPGVNTIEFSSITGPAQFTGMRLACEIIVPESLENGIASEETEYTINWRKPLSLASGTTASPKLGLMLEATANGWRAYIGKP